MRVPGFIGSSYVTQSAVAAGERSVNLFKEMVRSGGKTRAALYPTPGVVDFATFGDSPGRGIFAENDRLWAVYGTTLYEIDATGTPTARGTVAIDDHPAYMATNGDSGNELFTSSGDEGYILDLVTNTFTPVLSGVAHVGQIGAFFWALDDDTSELKISESQDGLTWDPTQRVLRASAADRWKAAITSRNEIFLFGNKTGEVYYNAGRTPFPFVQRSGVFFETGIAAPASLARFGQTIAWLGQSERSAGVVYWMNGYTPNAISNEGLEWVIQGYIDDGGIGDAVGWSYEREGHEFYMLTFPTQARTWGFDRMTNEWHERGLWSSIANDFTAYRPQFHAYAFGKHLVCDSQSNKLYALSSLVFTDVGGVELRRFRRTPHLSDEHRRLVFPYFELAAEVGVGLAAGQGVDPQVMLRYSNDGGKTWGIERTRSVGRQGIYDQRVRWDLCGSGRDRVWEVSSTDPVSTRWFDAYCEVA